MTAAKTLGVVYGPNPELLSCVDANLESLLAHAGVSDLLTVLGGPCGLDVVPLRHIELRPVPVGDWIRACTGLDLINDAEPTARAALAIARRVVGAGHPVLVTVDAYTVPWSPYHSREHHEHGFVVDGFDDDRFDDERWHVVDSYTNNTRYGRADPMARWFGAGELLGLGAFGEAVTVSHLAGELAPPGNPLARAVETVRLNQRAAAAARRQGRDVTALAAYPWEGETSLGMQWLSLATWLIARSRGLHARWWRQVADLDVAGSAGSVAGSAGSVVGSAGDVAEYGLSVAERAWQEAQSAAYLGWRRVEAGRPCPPNVAASLVAVSDAERIWFDRMADWLAAADGPDRGSSDVQDCAASRARRGSQ